MKILSDYTISDKRIDVWIKQIQPNFTKSISRKLMRSALFFDLGFMSGRKTPAKELIKAYHGKYPSTQANDGLIKAIDELTGFKFRVNKTNVPKPL